MKPVFNQVLIKPDEMAAEHKGIYIPKSARKPTFRGTIVDCGTGSHKSPMAYQPNQVVMYDSATPVSDDMIITHQKNILGHFIF